MARVVVVSFRLGETDGVSIEATKWIDALRTLGHDVSTLAGSGRADVVLAGLAMDATTPPSLDELEGELRGVDLTIVENLASLPFNPAARDLLYRVLDSRPALFRHHDLAWQRARWRHAEAPRTNPQWRHVTINERSRAQLSDRGVTAATIYNRFDCDPIPGRRTRTRHALGVGDERLLLFASRAIARKNVEGALQLARQLDGVVWLLGPSEDGYEPTLRRLLADSGTRVIRVRPEQIDDFRIEDAYAASDLVVVPSTWEGFGNPTIESVTHRRALAVYPYPVLAEIRAFGFRFFDLGDVAGLRQFLDAPDERLFEHNLKLARAHFDLAQLPTRLETLLEEWDFHSLRALDEER
jgi:glycosyltransferase involved in cell wall biosynthesis